MLHRNHTIPDMSNLSLTSNTTCTIGDSNHGLNLNGTAITSNATTNIDLQVGAVSRIKATSDKITLSATTLDLNSISSIYVSEGATIQMGNHTLGKVVHGIADIGQNLGSDRVKVVKIRFPSAFATQPVVVATPLQDPSYHGTNVPDMFAATIESVSPAGFTVKIYRLEAGATFQWSQDLKLSYMASV